MSLSEKRHNAIVDELKYGYFFTKDVREFIKELKEELGHNVIELEDVNGNVGLLKDVKVMWDFIKKKAGEELTE